MTDWDSYILEEERKAAVCARQVQGMIDAYGVPIARLEELAKMDLSVIDPKMLQELELAAGVKIESIVTEKPAATASRFLQRTRALGV